MLFIFYIPICAYQAFVVETEKMKTVLILKGLPASGKSTYARQLLDKEKGQWKRLNKDELRLMLTNGHHTDANEKFVERVRDIMLVEALKAGKHVVIDDTNLSDRPVARIENVVQQYRNETGEEVKIEINDMDISLDEAIDRDRQRDKKVGSDVIERMFRQHILKNERGPHYQPQDETLPKAILCDLDGTLAILSRSPFAPLACETDIVNEPIAEIVRNYFKLGVQVILLSGREDHSRALTEKWLQQHNIPYHHLYMRKEKDYRKDSIIKKELFDQYIKDKYFVQFVLDDRNQVVNLWRLDLGLPCLQVNYGDF